MQFYISIAEPVVYDKASKYKNDKEEFKRKNNITGKVILTDCKEDEIETVATEIVQKYFACISE